MAAYDRSELLNERDLAEKTLERNQNLTLAQKRKLISIIRDADTKLSRKAPANANPVNLVDADISSAGYNILSFFLPAFGAILYFSLKDAKPMKARGVLKWAFAGLCFCVQACFILMIFLLFLSK